MQTSSLTTDQPADKLPALRQQPASIASTLLTTEAVIVDAPKKDTCDHAMPDMGGMGGMGGMM